MDGSPAGMSAEAVSGELGLQHALGIDLSTGVVAGSAGGHHQRNQMFLVTREMALIRMRRLRPLAQGREPLVRRGGDGVGEPVIEGLRRRREARIAITAHVVKAHTAADDEYAFA